MTDNLKPLALTPPKTKGVTLHLLTPAQLPHWLSAQKAFIHQWVEQNGFTAQTDQILALPAEKGGIAAYAIGLGDAPDMWSIAHLPPLLPPQNYILSGDLTTAEIESLTLGWALGAYRFTQHMTSKPKPLATLTMPAKIDSDGVRRTAEATFLVRDLINQPANILGTVELAAAAQTVGKRYKAKVKIIQGKELLEQNYPAIYTVGMGSDMPPLLIDLTWGKASHPRLTLVGKGVVFDSGGYDIKPSAGMVDMKKDMGGAAQALALAQMIMDAALPVRLRLLIPAVENSVSGHAMRPRDVIPTRSGKTIEIGNTDAEGRVILADCLYEAAQDKPELLLDFATLTGARNVALGTEMGSFFCNDDALAAAIDKASREEQDPLWRLPLWQPYWRYMKSKVADMRNDGSTGMGGAITAALFLQQYLPKDQLWAHFDYNAYNVSPRAGRPEGGEAMGLRACFAVIEEKFKK